jgi:F-type H+-transporting ATPase subunit c
MGLSGLGAALAIGLAALGVSFSLAIVYFKTLDSIVRQPDLVGTFRVLMFIGFAFIEAIALYALVIAFQLVSAH